MALDGGRIIFTGEDIGPPGEAGAFLVDLGAAPDDQCVVDAPGRRWQARVDDLGLMGDDPLLGLASTSNLIDVRASR